MKRFIFLPVCLVAMSLALAGFAFQAAAQTDDSTSNVNVETEQSPETNLRCWKQETCEYSNPEKNIPQQGIWDKETAAAKRECGEGGAYGYCYALPEPINISISLPTGAGPVTKVANFGDYVDKLYQYLLGFATTVAIVFTMVGGIRYVLAAGTGEVSEAKKQITNAITGLVLLMFAYLILFTVNPQLVHLQMPSIPKIRTILFLTETPCEALIEAGYTVDPDYIKAVPAGRDPPVLCGKTKDSTIVADPNGVPVTGEDQTCQWHSCGGLSNAVSGLASGIRGAQKVCMQTDPSKTEENAYLGNSCVGCWEITVSGSNPYKNVTANSALCSYLSFEAPADTSVTPPKPSPWHFECDYVIDPGFSELSPADSLSKGMCALVSYNCDNIHSCSDYDSIIATNKDGTEPLYMLEAVISPLPSSIYSIHKSICEGNPCSSATNPIGPCRQDTTGFVASMAAAAVTAGATPAVTFLLDSLIRCVVAGP